MMKADTPKPGERRWALRRWEPGKACHGLWYARQNSAWTKQVGQTYTSCHAALKEAARWFTVDAAPVPVEWRETETWERLPDGDYAWRCGDACLSKPDTSPMSGYRLHHLTVVGAWHIVEDPFGDKESEPEPEGGDADDDGAENSGPADVTPGESAQEPAGSPAQGGRKCRRGTVADYNGAVRRAGAIEAGDPRNGPLSLREALEQALNRVPDFDPYGDDDWVVDWCLAVIGSAREET